MYYERCDWNWSKEIGKRVRLQNKMSSAGQDREGGGGWQSVVIATIKACVAWQGLSIRWLAGNVSSEVRSIHFFHSGSLYSELPLSKELGWERERDKCNIFLAFNMLTVRRERRARQRGWELEYSKSQMPETSRYIGNSKKQGTGRNGESWNFCAPSPQLGIEEKILLVRKSLIPWSSSKTN